MLPSIPQFEAPEGLSGLPQLHSCDVGNYDLQVYVLHLLMTNYICKLT